MSRPIFYQVKILDNADPLMLGRVRATLLTDNYDDIVKGITNPPWNEIKDKWTQRDPFIFNPLMPYFMYQVPKINEMAQIIYVNNDFKYQNQYYIQNTFSSPTSTNFEYYVGGNKFTGTGTQLKNPTPLKNQDGTYTNTSLKGVFPEPGDNALLGRGSADIIVKQDEVLIRAGKFYDPVLQPNVLPVANQRRSFLQLSRFDQTKIKRPDKIITESNEVIVAVKYLIEWVILNPENTQDKFTGSVYLYQLKNDLSTNSENLTVDSKVNDNLKFLSEVNQFTMLSKSNVIKFINNFIQKSNNDGDKFPFFYRPNNLTYSVLNPSTTTSSSSNSTIIKNITDIFNQIKLQPSQFIGGYDLVYAYNKVGTPMKLKTSSLPQSSYLNSPITYGAIGGNKVFLLSQDSSIPGKGKIDFDGSLYGFSNESFTDELIPKTSSLVRGEELMELINLITRFLVSHTHAYPGFPPTPITEDGTSVPNILSELQNAVNKILNGNIRLN